MPKLNTAAPDVPAFVTVADAPAASVVTVPTLTVAADPVAPVAPVGPCGPVVAIDADTRHTFDPLCSRTSPAHWVVVVALAEPSMVPPPDGEMVSVFPSLLTFLTETSVPATGLAGSVTVKPPPLVSAST